jgi:hypothetical protein
LTGKDNFHKLTFAIDKRFKQYYLKRIKDGLPYQMAVLATAHKLTRVMLAMLTNKTLFNTTMN